MFFLSHGRYGATKPMSLDVFSTLRFVQARPFVFTIRGLSGTHPRTIQMDKIAFDPSAATLVNVLTCDPTDQTKLLSLLRENIDTVVSTLDGWRSTTLVAAPDGVRVIIISQWRDCAAVTSMQSDARMQTYFPKIAALAAFDSIAGVVSYTCQA
jgi:quinol monooxygenase YgiN